MHYWNQKNSKALRQEIVHWIMKNLNVCQSPITCDTFLIADADTKVKCRMPKLLLECSMRQLYNELIASPYDGGLLGARHAKTNDVIISDTMLCSLAPPQLHPIADNHKIMCVCAICNTSNYTQEYLNAWRWKQLKTMKDKSDNSRGRVKDELTQAYKSYADYEFPKKENRHPHCENEVDSVLCTSTNDECKFPNWKCVLRKCTVCSSIALPGVEIGSSNRAPMIMFNPYMTHFTCSHHGILIREKITTHLDAKRKSKRTCFLCEELIKTKTPDFKRGKLHERVKLFSMQSKIGDFHKDYYIKQIKKLAYHRSY